MKAAKRVLSSVISLALLCTAWGANAVFAADDLFVISENGDYTYSETTPVVVKEGVTATVTLDSAEITASGSAFALEQDTDVTLILQGVSTLNADPDMVSAGIYVPEGAKLTIKGDGTLNAAGGKYGAGIGSIENVASGDITIEEGTINATGGSRGAGIGSGYHASGGNTTINGGTVTAIGRDAGAGIGSGYGTSGGASDKTGLYTSGKVVINGGTVRAAALNVDFDTIDPMDPSTLPADEGAFGAGIGGGYGASADVTITGGDIMAIGSCGGAGIGSGRGTSKAANYDENLFSVDVTISGDARVVAMATDDTRNNKGGGAAIGSGRGTHTGGTITITDQATVTAIASPFSAAIGAGSNTSPVDGAVPVADSITITEGVTLLAASDGTRFAVDTDMGTKKYDTITGRIQQILFDEAVLNPAGTTDFDLVYDKNIEKILTVPGGMKSVAVDVADTGTYYVMSGDLNGVQQDDSIEYSSTDTLEEHTCVALRKIEGEDQKGEDQEEEVPAPDANDPIALSNDYAYIFGRSETTMEPEENVLRGEACAMLYRLLKQNDQLGGFTYQSETPPIFPDLGNRWDRSAVEYMAYIGVYEQNGQPVQASDAISRGEAFKLFALSFRITEDLTLTPEQYAAALVKKGFIQGDENGSLNLDQNITRAEFCEIYNKITGRDQMSLTDADGAPVTAETYGFTDLSPSAWYYETVLRATSAYTDGQVDVSKRAVRNVVDDYE